MGSNVIDDKFEKVIKALADDTRDEKCLEEAIRLAHISAVKASSMKGVES